LEEHRAINSVYCFCCLLKLCCKPQTYACHSSHTVLLTVNLWLLLEKLDLQKYECTCGICPCSYQRLHHNRPEPNSIIASMSILAKDDGTMKGILKPDLKQDCCKKNVSTVFTCLWFFTDLGITQVVGKLLCTYMLKLFY
jgi:hypothetical protein